MPSISEYVSTKINSMFKRSREEELVFKQFKKSEKIQKTEDKKEIEATKENRLDMEYHDFISDGTDETKEKLNDELADNTRNSEMQEIGEAIASVQEFLENVSDTIAINPTTFSHGRLRMTAKDQAEHDDLCEKMRNARRSGNEAAFKQYLAEFDKKQEPSRQAKREFSEQCKQKAKANIASGKTTDFSSIKLKDLLSRTTIDGIDRASDIATVAYEKILTGALEARYTNDKAKSSLMADTLMAYNRYDKNPTPENAEKLSKALSQITGKTLSPRQTLKAIRATSRAEKSNKIPNQNLAQIPIKPTPLSV